MTQKFFLSIAAMFVLAFGLDFLVHGVILYGDYERLGNLMRPPADAQAKMPVMIVAYICLAVAFTWIYQKGRENKPWLSQGVRYGVAVALLAAVPTYLIYHVVSPFPIELAIKQIVLESIVIVLMGIALAWINR